MTAKHAAIAALKTMRTGLVSAAVLQLAIGNTFAGAQSPQYSHDSHTTSPIKHVIVIIGENRSFDHVFATYVPRPGETVWNLLSEGIIKADGTPGPNFSKAQQLAATDTAGDAFLLSPPKQEFPSNQLPTPLAGGPSGANGYFSGSNPCNTPAGQTPLTPAQ